MKKYLFGILAISLAVTSVAFTTIPTTKKASPFYYQFTGENYFSTSDWSDMSTTPFDECGGSELTCTIQSSSLSTKTLLVNFLINSGGTQRDPQIDHGTNYVILSRED